MICSARQQSPRPTQSATTATKCGGPYHWQGIRWQGVYAGPGIFIKLSALHPRYSRAQSDRLIRQLLTRVKQLALVAKQYDFGLNIDAEEADRLEVSLDLLDDLSLDNELSGRDGLGFVVQVYGKRCPFVLHYIINLARRAGRRMMVRLVKGAYWGAEINRAQLDGLEGFPVYTRKVYTDVAYVACAPKLLAADDAVFPQFATHNAQTLAAIYHPASPISSAACLNGANSSFVNRISDPAVSIDDLVTDPVDLVEAMPVVGMPHDQTSLPSALYGKDRTNSSGIDLSNEAVLADLSLTLADCVAMRWYAVPELVDGSDTGATRPITNRRITLVSSVS